MKSPILVSSPPAKPLVIFDGDCGFCRRWVNRWQTLTAEAVDYAPSGQDDIALRFPEISPDAFQQSIILITPNGTVWRGAEAVFRTLACAPGKHHLLWCYRSVPGFAAISERIYAFVAAHRYPFSVLTRWFLPDTPPRYELTRSIFLRGLGVIYLIAFVSLWFQVDGLIGKNGIVPISQFMTAAESQLHGIHRFLEVPTLCWINSGDTFLHFQCAAGTVLSLFLMAGIAPAFCLGLLWILYLSLTVAGNVFFEFQWDNLLLETGFIAIFFSPLTLFLRQSGEPSRLILFLFRWLIFRLFFMSACVKLLSGDRSWSDLSALQYHYETQPLPSILAWHASQRPAWLHSASVLAMFAIELTLPFLIFGPKSSRLIAAFPLLLLQVAIALTGNYGFFNVLSILLLVLLLDDRSFSRGNDRKLRAWSRFHKWPFWTTLPIAAVALLITSLQLSSLWLQPQIWPKAILTLARFAQPFRSINQYGLFAVMTKTRSEIIIEGSNDRKIWKAYEFKYKPGDPNRAPSFVAPYQPRLDWQMWFAALGTYEQNPWFMNFCARVLEGPPEVLALLKTNPFPGAPPLYLRAVVYDYRFTNTRMRAASGAWWKRQYKGLYCPELSLKQADDELTRQKPGLR